MLKSPNSKTLCEFLRISLLAGFMKKKHLIKVIDKIIAQKEKPQSEFLNISTGIHKSIYELADELKKIHGEANKKIAFKMFLALANIQLQKTKFTSKSIADIINKVSSVLFSFEEITKDIHTMVYFEDVFWGYKWKNDLNKKSKLIKKLISLLKNRITLDEKLKFELKKYKKFETYIPTTIKQNIKN